MATSTLTSSAAPATAAPATAPESADIAARLARASEGLAEADRERLAAAVEFVKPLYGKSRLGTGESTLAHALALAVDLASLKLDAATRTAGILFAVPSHLTGYRETLAETFGGEVANLVAGIARLHELRLVTRGVAGQQKSPERAAQVEVLRKMLLAMVDDIRGVLVRLASRTQTLRFLFDVPGDLRRALAQETIDIYAPLANRLGVWQLKWELEDYAFRYLEPEAFADIARQIDERRDEREDYMAGVIAELRAVLARNGIAAEVSGRPKHIYSIYNKMRTKNRAFGELYDLRAVRVLVADMRACYTVLGLVHEMWAPIPEEFDDYIARPKANGYRSLHTVVTGPQERTLEIQIRTHEMHGEAELGVAAHWRYKEGAAPEAASSYEQRIAWLRQVLAWRDEVVSGAEWLEQLKTAARDNTVYVLSPQGRVVDLPEGATPVDFAYALHTDIGHRCRGAKVDGVMVPLDTRLANGQRVEIIAAKEGGPSRDWLNPERGYIASSRARTKVRQYFNQIETAETASAGRAIVEREMQREARAGASLEALARHFGFAKTDDFYAAVGREDLNARQIQIALRGEHETPPPADEPRIGKAATRADSAGVLVVGIDRLMTQLAKCCRPVPPDKVRGFVTKGRGVSIHRAECPSLAVLVARHPERAIECDWGAQSAAAVYPVDILVQAHDRQGLLRDVSDVFARDRINVIGVNTVSRRSVATMQFTAEVASASQLAKALAGVREVAGVFTVTRK